MEEEHNISELSFASLTHPDVVTSLNKWSVCYLFKKTNKDK